MAGAAIAIAGLAAVVTLYVRQFTPALWQIAACATIAIAFAAANPLLVRGLRMKRSGLAAEAIFLDIPVVAPLVAALGTPGAVAACIALAVGFGTGAWFRRTNAPTDVARHGVLRLLCVLAIVPFAGSLAQFIAGLGRSAPFAFALVLLAALLTFMFGIAAPLSAALYNLRTPRVIERVARDPRTWTVMGASLIWATMIDAVLLAHMPSLLVIVMWLPVVTTAVLLRTIDEQHQELHRLRLVRDAVQAMLGDKDPLPQINAILATLRVPSFDETVTVLAATSQRTDQWRVVTNLGPALSPAGDELHRRLLARLKFSGREPQTMRDEYYVAYAFPAIEAERDDVHGALIVHRRPDRALTPEQIAQFSNAARELTPLLRDMRSIVAAQSAATVDVLTGLYNRGATTERLQSMLEEGGMESNGAVLLLDIDHFKTINDQLGHAAGDDCLRKIGDLLRGGIRSGDAAGRIGGEEFLVVMPGATREVALAVAERLRLAIALSGMRYATGDPVTASIGVSCATTGDISETILARADRALYEAKRGGRNRTVEIQQPA